MKLKGVPGWAKLALIVPALGAMTGIAVAQMGANEPAMDADEPAMEAEDPAMEAAAGEMVSIQVGVYTEEQAERGLATFMSRGCNGCHGNEMQGSPGGPTLKGFLFNFHWGDKPATEVMAFMQANMPPGAAGSLTDQAYTDILAAIFHANGYPVGDDELVYEELANILVENAPQE
ncbi:MAG: hypothetical protein KIS96_12310 [Bauldia sp.]|nr:hypothetical protein [Bauldia sp.]